MKKFKITCLKCNSEDVKIKTMSWGYPASPCSEINLICNNCKQEEDKVYGDE
jgi:hypothetical protein